jgi:lipoate-protein ligase A
MTARFWQLNEKRAVIDRAYRRAFFQVTGDHFTHETVQFRAIEHDGEPEGLSIWEASEPTVIVGALAHVNRQVHQDHCEADGVPIVRRSSGGGAVVIGRGCLNYSLSLSLDERPELRNVQGSYRLILTRLVEALDMPGLELRGLGDLAIGDRKVGGSSQRRGRRALLHHGTLLYDFDLSLMDRYLKHPDREPAYRDGRRHLDFVANVTIHSDLIKDAMTRAWRW